MKIRLRAKAQADLAQLLSYSFVEHGEAAARRYMADIEAAFAWLADYPELGVPEPALGSYVRSYPVGEHRIYYRIIDERVSIGRVLHKRMDARRRM